MQLPTEALNADALTEDYRELARFINNANELQSITIDEQYREEGATMLETTVVVDGVSFPYLFEYRTNHFVGRVDAAEGGSKKALAYVFDDITNHVSEALSQHDEE